MAARSRCKEATGRAAVEVVWRASALDDLIGIADYLGPLNPAAASRIVNAIERAGDSLTNLPHRGLPTGRPNLRWLRVPRTKYLLLYRVVRELDRVEILRAVHGRRDRRRMLGD